MTATEYIRELNRAEGYVELVMPEDAWQVLQDIPSDLKMRPEVLLLRVRILLALGLAKEAEGFAQIAVSFAPRSGAALFCLAVTQAQLGMRASARDNLAAALLLNTSLRRIAEETLKELDP